MKKTKGTIDDEFYKVIVDNIDAGEQLNTQEIYKLFPYANRKTISWRLYKFVQQGKMFREEQGYYSISPKKEHMALGYDYLQKLSQEVYDIVVEYDYKFYFTGLDALGGEILHIPEKFPVLLVVEESGIEYLLEELGAKGFVVFKENDLNILKNNPLKNKIDIILLKGKDFSMAIDNIANKEKGFVDLYYAVTKLDYQISVLELIRIYESMKRNKTITTLKMKKSAKDRGIQTEINWILGLKKTTQKGKEFMLSLLKEEIK